MMGLANEYAALEGDGPPPAPAPKKRGAKPKAKPPKPQPDRATPEPGATPKQNEARAVFAELDADGDGALSSVELSNRLSDFGLGDAEISGLFTQLDLNNDGQIDMDEWIAGYDRYQELALGGSAPLTRTMSRSLELDILEALVEARAKPELVAERIKKRLGWLKGKSMHRPGRPVAVETKEGKGAVNDALAFLAKQPPLPGFATEPVAGLALAAEDHVADIGPKGLVQHEGSDDSYFGERQKRYGTYIGAAGECLWYGKTGAWLSGRDMIDDLIVDDGVESRGHRLCIYEEKYGCAGVSVGGHDIYSNMAAIEFAAAYEDDEDKVSARQDAGPPKVVASAGGGKPDTQWVLGCCRGCNKPIKGGSVVTIPCSMHPKGNDKCKDCRKWHADCFVCTSCSTPLAGVAGKKMEKGNPYCNGCWTKEFGDVCAYCSKPIEGKVVKVGKTKKTAKCYHPECNEKRKKEAAGAKPSMGTKPGKGGGKKGVKKKGGKTTFAGAQQTMGGMGDMFAGLE